MTGTAGAVSGVPVRALPAGDGVLYENGIGDPSADATGTADPLPASANDPMPGVAGTPAEYGGTPPGVLKGAVGGALPAGVAVADGGTAAKCAAAAPPPPRVTSGAASSTTGAAWEATPTPVTVVGVMTSAKRSSTSRDGAKHSDAFGRAPVSVGENVRL